MKNITKTILGVLLIAGLLCVAQSGWCKTNPGDFSLSPMFGGHVFEGNQDIDNGPTLGIGLGYQITDHWGTEAFCNCTPTYLDPGNNDIYVFPVHLDAVYNIFPDDKLVPYVAAGLGAMVFDPVKGGGETDFMTNYGAGIKYFINDTFALRLDVRHLISFDDTQSNLLYTVGLMVNFGVVKPVPAQDVEKDSDGDGVMDSQDKCPGTPQNTPVDAFGCPLETPKADSDGDGIPDYEDKCPNTPKRLPGDVCFIF